MASHSLLSRIRRFNFIVQTTDRWRSISSTSSLLTKNGHNLKTQIMRLHFPWRSATTELHNWIREGRRISIPQLRHIIKKLLKSKRHEHALEIFAWMETENKLSLSPADHVTRLELIMKVHGISEAENYFDQLSNTASQKATYLPLLHGYVKENNTQGAESLMAKLMNMGLILNPHPYNEMMKLYMATSQSGKVPLVIKQMKQNQVPRSVLSYNLYMNACGELYGVDSVDKVYEEMLSANNVEVGWSTLCTLANVYIKSSLVDKAIWALRTAEKKLSKCNRIGYFFLITLYTSLNDKEGVLRVWKASKLVDERITCANYMCLLLCLVKLGDIKEAERIFTEWESNCRKYDIRVSNVLLGAYVRKGLMEKAESLHLRTLERGGSPNYKTWEILVEGWAKGRNPEMVTFTMNQRFSMLKQLIERPQRVC